MIEEVVKYLAKIYKSKEKDIDISKFESFDSINNKKEVFAVDGGSGIIFDGGSLIVAKIKIGVVGYKEKNKIFEKVDEYFMSVIDSKNGRIIKFFPDINIALNLTKKEIEDLPNEARDNIEKIKINELSKKYPDALILADGQRDINLKNVVSICKTSRAKTKSGRSLLGQLNEMSDKKLKGKKWFYKISDGEYIIKFHELSKFCYRVLLNENTNIKQALGLIADYSRDPEIIGYPYPLLKVDKIARLRDDEKKFENQRFKMFAKKIGLKVEYDEMSTLMHKYMDERAYRR